MQRGGAFFYVFGTRWMHGGRLEAAYFGRLGGDAVAHAVRMLRAARRSAVRSVRRRAHAYRPGHRLHALRRPPFGDLLCTECRGMPIALDHCLAATVFAGPPASMIRAFKDGGEMRLVDVLADLLTGALLDAERSASERFGHPLLCADAVTFVPATAEAFRRRGFDHMEMICSGVSDRVGLPMVDVLVKHGCSDQRGAGREERARLSRGVYEVVGSVRGLKVLVLDDVITTGATLNAVAAALRGAGAARVDGAAVARVWGQD